MNDFDQIFKRLNKAEMYRENIVIHDLVIILIFEERTWNGEAGYNKGWYFIKGFQLPENRENRTWPSGRVGSNMMTGKIHGGLHDTAFLYIALRLCWQSALAEVLGTCSEHYFSELMTGQNPISIQSYRWAEVVTRLHNAKIDFKRILKW